MNNADFQGYVLPFIMLCTVAMVFFSGNSSTYTASLGLYEFHLENFLISFPEIEEFFIVLFLYDIERKGAQFVKI